MENRKSKFKLLDLIIILIVILIGAIGIVIYYASNKDDSNTVVVYYNNQELFEFDINSNIRKITVNSGANGKKNSEFVIVTYDRFSNEIATVEKTMQCDEALSYQIEIVNEKVYVTVSTCKNHLCEKMVLSKTLKTPIICTSGIVIKYKEESLDLISK